MPNKQSLNLIKNYIKLAQTNINLAVDLLNSLDGEYTPPKIAGMSAEISKELNSYESEAGSIIEGVFDGQSMICPDGKKYNVPANYASKSKLLEGDILKLTISDQGQFIYKQIKPVERIRIKGVLNQDPETREFTVMAEGRIYKVLTASVTYFKGTAGDDAVIFVPVDKISEWAAIENIIPMSNSSFKKSDDEEFLPELNSSDQSSEHSDGKQDLIDKPEDADEQGFLTEISAPDKVKESVLEEI